MSKADIIKDALRRFPSWPHMTLAKYILANYGNQFDGSLELVRSRIRYYTGNHGQGNRNKVGQLVPRTVVMPKTWRTARERYSLNAGKWLVLGDIHIPFHEPRALDAALEYGKKHGVTGILLNGDAQDCAAISYWPSTMKRDFDKEVEAFIDFLDILKREFPKQEIVYKPGNHEYRLPRLFAQMAPELLGAPLQAMDSVLGLEARGIKLLEYKQIVMAGKLPILHGDEIRGTTRAVNPARGLFLKTKSYALCHHFHTTSEHTSTNIQGTYLTCWSCGCLSDLHPDYSIEGNDWNHGFAVIEHDGRDFEVFNKRILKNGTVV